MRCEHFEREGLARQEAGRPDPHVVDCADCQAARATYRRMTDALADVGADLRPRAGWEEQVVARVAAPRRSRRWLGAGLGGALLAAAVVLLMLKPRQPVPHESMIARVPSGSTTRGVDEAWAAGDSVFAFSAVAGGAVWIYRVGAGQDGLALACDTTAIDPPRCMRKGAGVRAILPTMTGTYQVFAFRRAAPGPAPSTYDEATALVSRVDGWATIEPIDVR